MIFREHFDEWRWNGWKVTRLFSWYCARRPDKATIWFHASEFPLNCGWGNEQHIIKFLNGKLP